MAPIAQVNSEMEDGDSLDSVRVKAIFMLRFFGADSPSRVEHRRFVDCFVTYEERTRTVTTTDAVAMKPPRKKSYRGSSHQGTACGMRIFQRPWALPLPMKTKSMLRRFITECFMASLHPPNGSEFDEWSDGLPLTDAPFIGADGFCSPLGESWRSMVTSEFGYRKDPFTGQTKRS